MRFSLTAADNEIQPLPRMTDIFDFSRHRFASLKMRPVPEILVIFRFYAADEISFDIDLRDIDSQVCLDHLCDFLRAAGAALGKPVRTTPEGRNMADPFLGARW